MKPVISVVVPAYNEEEVLETSYGRLTAVLTGLNEPYELLFVDDGSRDRTEVMLEGLAKKDSCVKVIRFSRNFGHMAALTAGLDHAAGDAVVVIDADLQDPPELIPAMVAKWREGWDVVYGKRTKRQGESRFKKTTAALYYRLLNKLTNVDIPLDTGEFRLIDRKVKDVLTGLTEHNRYMRGLISWIGFRQCAVEYVREGRFAGETKYSMKKMLELSINGIASFSLKPLRFISMLGFAAAAAGFVWLLVLFVMLLTGNGPNGWTVAIAALTFSQGLVLLAIGVLGEYVGRGYEEAKGRPGYIIAKKTGFPEE